MAFRAWSDYVERPSLPFRMGNRPSCRSCRHSSPPDGGQAIWCQLRQLAIHPDLAGDLWCHHWTARSPKLPVMAPHGVSAQPPADEQLTLAGMEREEG
ncbi:MAG: hypothetical protein ACK55X_05570 [Synechococcaceae cyanobacterium]